MWKSKLFKQTVICLALAFTIFAAQKSDIPQLNRGSEAAIAYLSQNYTFHDVLTFARDSAKAVARTPAAVTNAVLSAEEKSRYADPIDEVKNGETVTVYAVAAGTVSAVGENEKIGKFIKILHGEDAESIYGNCKTIHVKELDRVKKGQAIGTFKKDKNTEFYYHLSKLN